MDSEGEEIEDNDTPRSMRRPSSGRHSPKSVSCLISCAAVTTMATYRTMILFQNLRTSPSPHRRSPQFGRSRSPQLSSQTRSRSPPMSRPRTRTPVYDEDDDDDSDEDIVMTSGKIF